MPVNLDIGLIGDLNPEVPAHRAIPIALALAAQALSLSVTATWVPTESIGNSRDVERFQGLWCVPASPYRSLEGALHAIRFARESKRPFLGTCGGFQHAVLEQARNVLGWSDAAHGEVEPLAPRAVISPLSCPLVEVSGTVHLRPGTRLANAYGCLRTVETYHCRYGLNPDFRATLMTNERAGFRLSAVDDTGDIRGLELVKHPFFVATLFQPERAALTGELPPLVTAFVRACLAGHDGPMRV